MKQHENRGSYTMAAPNINKVNKTKKNMADHIGLDV
jgi:hypothetical protein